MKVLGYIIVAFGAFLAGLSATQTFICLANNPNTAPLWAILLVIGFVIWLIGLWIVTDP